MSEFDQSAMLLNKKKSSEEYYRKKNQISNLSPELKHLRDKYKNVMGRSAVGPFANNLEYLKEKISNELKKNEKKENNKMFIFKNNRYYCRRCNKNYNNKSGVWTHMRSNHKSVYNPRNTRKKYNTEEERRDAKRKSNRAYERNKRDRPSTNAFKEARKRYALKKNQEKEDANLLLGFAESNKQKDGANSLSQEIFIGGRKSRKKRRKLRKKTRKKRKRKKKTKKRR